MRTTSLSYALLSALLLGALLLATGAHAPVRAQAQQPVRESALVVDDFQSYDEGTAPDKWKYITRSKDVLPLREVSDETEHVRVQREDQKKFARAYTRNESLRITTRNGVDFDWNIKRHPYLQWEWRAVHLPRGASEEDKNDAGGAVYVTFGADWTGFRPKSIKYTYSSTLPVGTVISQGPLRVLVVASALDRGTGQWKTELRDVAADYRQVFGGNPPDEPVSITLWSDSDTTEDYSKMDFDNVRLMPTR